MRRFISSLLAKSISRTLIVTMLMMSAHVLVVTKAQAQTGTQPNWAVVDFVNKSNYGGATTASLATDAVTRELTKNPKYTIVPKTSVEQQLKELGFRPPLRQLDYMKLGQELGADAIVAGNVESITISKNPPRARVIVSVYVYDTASGYPITGASGIIGESSARPGMTGGEDAMVQEAIQYAAFTCVNRVSSLNIHDATVSFANPSSVILDRGSRDGLKAGMEMLILRYKDYVARVRVTDVSGDDANAQILEYTKGVRPGDRARAIFTVEKYEFKNGRPVRSGARTKNVGAIIGTTLILLLVVMLIGKNGGSNTATDNVTSEATFDPAQGVGIRVSWHANLFAAGTWTRVEWHIWRDDIATFPIGVVPGNENFFIDDTTSGNISWVDQRVNSGGITCASEAGAATAARVGLVPGTSYNYKVDLVYRQSCLDVPGCTSGTDCYFESSTVRSKGLATALNQVTLESPQNNSKSVDAKTVNFIWDSVVGSNDYIVQVSPDIRFVDVTVNVYESTTALTGIISTGNLNLTGLATQNIKFWKAPQWYWRVGARNVGDSPGPLPDAHGNRFVFSQPYQFTPVGLPPPPPGRPK